MTERMLTSSKITAWLDCGAYLDLVRQVEAGLLEHEGATTVVRARSAGLRRSSRQSGKWLPARSLGIAKSIVPTRVSHSRGR